MLSLKDFIKVSKLYGWSHYIIPSKYTKSGLLTTCVTKDTKAFIITKIGRSTYNVVVCEPFSNHLGTGKTIEHGDGLALDIALGLIKNNKIIVADSNGLLKVICFKSIK